MKKLKVLFPYEYAGGGYFKKKNEAKVLHGMEAIKYLYDKMKEGGE